MEGGVQAGECEVWENLAWVVLIPLILPETALIAFASAQPGEAGAGSIWPVEVDLGLRPPT